MSIMGNIRFKDNKILFDSNAIAMHEDCCCEEPCETTICCSDVDDWDVTLTVEGGPIFGNCIASGTISKVGGSEDCCWRGNIGDWTSGSGLCPLGADKYVSLYCEGDCCTLHIIAEWAIVSTQCSGGSCVFPYDTRTASYSCSGGWIKCSHADGRYYLWEFSPS